MGKHRTPKKIYTYCKRKVTFEHLVKKAKKRGISRSTLNSRILSGWSASEAVEVPLRKHRKGRRISKKDQGNTTWVQVACPVSFCRAPEGLGCLLPNQSKRKRPHAERRERAEGDDRHLVPPDWQQLLEAVRRERRDEIDRDLILQDQIHSLLGAGMTQKAAGALLEISSGEVDVLMHGAIYGRRSARLEHCPKTTLRPLSSKVFNSELRLSSSAQPCGGGWRVSRGPREDPSHTGSG